MFTYKNIQASLFSTFPSTKFLNNLIERSYQVYKSTLGLSFIIIGSMILNGCSTAPLPSVPEISHATIVKPRPIVRKQPPRQKPIVTPYKPQNKPQLKIYSAVTPNKTTEEIKEEQIKQAQEKATVNTDPYSSIPDNSSKPKISSSTTISTPETSSAVISLIASARSNLAIGNTKSATSNLERGLRIEPQNPILWHLIAQAQYDQSSYQQAISMSKKSIRYSNSDDLRAKNWTLIKNAGDKSGDSVAIKEANDYFKVNP